MLVYTIWVVLSRTNSFSALLDDERSESSGWLVFRAVGGCWVKGVDFV